jgi:hypothetical protein
MPWFKLYGGDLLNDMDYSELSDTEKSILIELWCLASQYDGKLPDIKKIAFRLRRDEQQVLDSINKLEHWIDLSRDSLDSVYTEAIPDKIRGDKIREDKIRREESEINALNTIPF